jgi:hypothetical protein
MSFYRVIRENVSLGDLSGETPQLRTAIQMAKEYSRRKKGAKFIVEKVERVWPKEEPRPKGNAIHASIHRGEDFG